LAPVEVNLFATFKAIAGKKQLFFPVLPGQTIQDTLFAVLEELPTLRPHWLDTDGHPRPYVHIYLNQADSATLPDGLRTIVRDGDILDFIPPVAGG